MASQISVIQPTACRAPRVNDSSLAATAQHDTCVIHPNECPYEFVNPLDLDIMVDHFSCSGVASIPIGHCGGMYMGENRHCALTKDACEDPNDFVHPPLSLSDDQHAHPDGGSCTVLQDLNYFGTNLNKNDGLTRYIGCSGGNLNDLDKDGHVCVASIPECRELAGSDDSVTITLSDPKCDCSETRIGACFRTGDFPSGIEQFNYFCAASEEVCDEELGLSYHDVNQLMQFSSIDCRLCDAADVKEFKVATKTVPISSVGAIVGISCATVVATALLLLLFRSLIRRKEVVLDDAPEDMVLPSSVSLSNNDKKDNSDDENTLALQEDGKTFQEEDEEVEEEENVEVHRATYT